MNNEAEYKAFIIGLQSTNKLEVPKVHIFSDSKLVVNQVMRKFEARGINMEKYLAVAKKLHAREGLEFTCKCTGRLGINF